MPSAPKVPQHFRIHGQTDTDSEVDQGDVHMEPASAAPIDYFPPLDAASVAARASRTAYKQQRRQEEEKSVFETLWEMPLIEHLHASNR